MVRLAADQNFNEDILRGLLRRLPALDVRLVRDVGLSQADDPTVLEWAAAEGRVLLTHDRATLPDFAYDRVRAGRKMPGVFLVSDRISVGHAVDDLCLLILACLSDGEWEDQVMRVPLP